MRIACHYCLVAIIRGQIDRHTQKKRKCFPLSLLNKMDRRKDKRKGKKIQEPYLNGNSSSLGYTSDSL